VRNRGGETEFRRSIKRKPAVPVVLGIEHDDGVSRRFGEEEGDVGIR
jgi:hypothetical protein